jgi:elongation factor 1-alpha
MVTIPKKENKNIEFKEKLSPEIHLKKEKKQHLATQMKYLLDTGNGTAVYIVGVDDDGNSKGLTDIEFEETLSVLKTVATENNAQISKIEKFIDNGSFVGKIIINRILTSGTKSHIVIGVCGHVNHGKSTLIGSLMAGSADINGKHWLYLDTLPHEIERNLSADLHYALFGFKDGKPQYMKNPLDKKERSKIVEHSDKIISFVDSPGHEPWIRTAIRGLVGQNIDYGLLVVASDDGITYLTKEHLGLLLAMNLPIVVCITKIDKVSEKKIEDIEAQVEELIKNVGRIPFSIKDESDLQVVVDKLEVIIPVIRTSARNYKGYDLLIKLLSIMPERKKDLTKPFLMFIDKVYNITGVGAVVSGTIKQGKLQAGKELILGPDQQGNLRKVKATSIEMHYHQLNEANAGLIVGIALRGIKPEEVGRGMILCDQELEPKPVKTFEADIMILTHPTMISSGYEPVLHCNTIAESVKLELLDKSYLKSGETAKVRMSFRYKPQFVQEEDKFVFREGETKGIGTITKILKYAI